MTDEPRLGGIYGAIIDQRGRPPEPCLIERVGGHWAIIPMQSCTVSGPPAPNAPIYEGEPP